MHVTYLYLKVLTSYGSLITSNTMIPLTPWTIKSENGRWPFSIVQLLKENQSINALGPSLVVNRMWTRMNNHASNKWISFFILFLWRIIIEHYLGFISCFRLFSSWFSTSMVAMEKRRTNPILIVWLYMFLYVLVKHVVDYQALLLQWK